VKSNKAKRILFLLRTYNDIDHIAPIIWKSATSGWTPFFLFVDADYSDDYRIKFVIDHGARQVRSWIIEWYHSEFRGLLRFRLFKRISDRMFAYTFGLLFLFKNRINIVVNEWSGPYGRIRAEYFLRPATFLGLPIYSLPHGYFLWLNPLFNREKAEMYESRGNYPNFSNRNCFTKYVVQSPEHKEENIKNGMSQIKLVVLGSARFCREWSHVNYKLLCKYNRLSMPAMFTVLFFLPHWHYNVYRGNCIALLKKIADLENVCLRIKSHTRGTGALSATEKNSLEQKRYVEFPNSSVHSTLLVDQSDVVINFGSSIAFEALRQGKPVINPTYLHGNQTFFDNSKAVIDTNDEESTLNAIVSLQKGEDLGVKQDCVDNFLINRVEGGVKGGDVLQSYLSLLYGCEN